VVVEGEYHTLSQETLTCNLATGGFSPRKWSGDDRRSWSVDTKINSNRPCLNIPIEDVRGFIPPLGVLLVAEDMSVQIDLALAVWSSTQLELIEPIKII
jgi:hypothetical protein